jgi:tetratricopeptide (TPR) repeat protein
LAPGHSDLSLLTSRFSPKIADFGLAKQLDAPDGFTQTGAVLGTPSYMAPEQAWGKTEQIGPRSDIYALGAILYELLTGRPPFKGTNKQETLDQVRLQEPVPPRRLQPKVPRDLETLCLKCLEKEPAKRYANAGGLADELGRVLRDEPIRARPVARVERLWRWCRRKPALAALSGGLALAILGGLLATTTFWLLAETNAEAARRETIAKEKESKKAIKNAADAEEYSRHARKTLDHMTSAVIDEWLVKQPKLTEEQKRFLELALVSYEKFTTVAAETTDQRAALAKAYARVASLRDRLGLRAEAVSAYRRAVEIHTRLVSEFPAVLKYRQELAELHNNLALLLAELGQRTGPASAEEHFQQALAIRQKLASEFPAVHAYRGELAASYHNRAIWQAALGQRTGPDSAEEHYQRALTLREQLASEFPALPDYRKDLAINHTNLAVLLTDLGRRTGPNSADEHNRRALAILKALADEFPGVPAYRQALAGTHTNLGLALLLTDPGRRTGPDSVEEHYRRGLALRRELAADFPAVPEYRKDLAASHLNLGNVLAELGNRTGPDSAAEHYRQALTVVGGLAAEFPTAPEYRDDLADSHNNLASLLMDLGRRSGPDSAEEHFHKALHIRRQLVAEFPNFPAYSVALAKTYYNLGRLLHAGDRPADAPACYGKSIEALEPLVKKSPKLHEAHAVLKTAVWWRARALSDLGRHAEALKDWDRAVELHGEHVLNTRLGRALCLARLGEGHKAFQEAQLMGNGNWPGRTLQELAQVSAVCAAKAKEPGQRADRSAAQALLMLERAKKIGWFRFPGRLERLQKNTDFEALWPRKDFALFVAELEKQQAKVLASFKDQLMKADRKDKPLDQLPHKIHEVKLVAGKSYAIEMGRVDEFDPFLRLEDSAGRELDNNDDGGEDLDARILFSPPKDGTYRIIATTLSRAGEYRLWVRELEPRGDGKVHSVGSDGLQLSDRLISDDLPDRVRKQSASKVYQVTLNKEATYTIDLKSQDFDAFLRLEDKSGKELVQDDDSGKGPKGLNARIEFTPHEYGVYRVIVTTFAGGLGDFALSVREERKADSK